MDDQMPWRHRVVAQALGRLEAFVLDQGKHGGLPELTTRSSDQYVEAGPGEARGRHRHRQSQNLLRNSPRPDPRSSGSFSKRSAGIFTRISGLTMAWSPSTTRRSLASEQSWPSSARPLRFDQPIPLWPRQTAPPPSADRRDRHGRRIPAIRPSHRQGSELTPETLVASRTETFADPGARPPGATGRTRPVGCDVAGQIGRRLRLAAKPRRRKMVKDTGRVRPVPPGNDARIGELIPVCSRGRRS